MITIVNKKWLQNWYVWYNIVLFAFIWCTFHWLTDAPKITVITLLETGADSVQRHIYTSVLLVNSPKKQLCSLFSLIFPLIDIAVSIRHPCPYIPVSGGVGRGDESKERCWCFLFAIHAQSDAWCSEWVDVHKVTMTNK